MKAIQLKPLITMRQEQGHEGSVSVLATSNSKLDVVSDDWPSRL